MNALATIGTAVLAFLLANRWRPRHAPRRPSPTARLQPDHIPTARRRRAIWLTAVVVAVAVIGGLGGGGVAIASALLAVGWFGTASRRTARRHRRTVTSAMPETLDLVIVCIEAGHLPLDALRLLHPVLPPVIGDAFADVVARVDRGERFGSALGSLPERLGPSSLTFVDALIQTDRAGLAFGPAVERLADDARDHRRRLAEAAARELPVRLSFPLVLCTLPSFVLVAIVPLLIGALASVHVG